jgi:hypothetical protein
MFPKRIPLNGQTLFKPLSDKQDFFIPAGLIVLKSPEITAAKA